MRLYNPHPVRRLRTILTVVSFILFLIIVADWCSSYWAGNQIDAMLMSDAATVDREVGIVSASGQIRVAFYLSRSPMPNPQFGPGLHFSFEAVEAVFFQVTYLRSPLRMGFGFDHVDNTVFSQSGQTLSFIMFFLPSWFLAAVFAILPVHWVWRRYRRRNEIREGLCPNCGYDLRATPDRCPECGTTIELKEAKPVSTE